jgi:phage shock protein E
MKNMKTYILDVRSPEEFKYGYIENAINLPIDELLNRSEYALSILKTIHKEDDQIKVYCASGARAAMVKSILEFMQYKDVVNLGGVS